MSTERSHSHETRPDARALKIIAKSLYRELRSQGHSRGDIVVFTNALLELVTEDSPVTAEAAE